MRIIQCFDVKLSFYIVNLQLNVKLGLVKLICRRFCQFSFSSLRHKASRIVNTVRGE